MNSLQTQTAQQTPCTSNVSQTEDIPDPIQVKVFRSCFELLHGLALKNEKVHKMKAYTHEHIDHASNSSTCLYNVIFFMADSKKIV